MVLGIHRNRNVWGSGRGGTRGRSEFGGGFSRGDSWGFEFFSSEIFQEHELSPRAEKADRKVVLDEGSWERNQEDGRRARHEGSNPKTLIGETDDSPAMKAAGGTMDAMCADPDRESSAGMNGF
jgi:hypothetical protein